MKENIVKKNLSRILIAALTLCLVVGTILCSPVEAYAASGYKKSFTKTITLKGNASYQEYCDIVIEVKKSTTIKGSIKALTTLKKTEGADEYGNEYEIDEEFHMIRLQGEGTSINRSRQSGVFKEKLSKGKYTLRIFGNMERAIKFKIGVTAGSAVLKCKSVKIRKDN